MIQRPGAGSLTPPFVQRYGGGDTDAFPAAGPVHIEVKDLNGSTSCDLVLRDSGNGQDVNFGTARAGAPLVLDPYAHRLVYLADLTCSIQVTVG